MYLYCAPISNQHEITGNPYSVTFIPHHQHLYIIIITLSTLSSHSLHHCSLLTFIERKSSEIDVHKYIVNEQNWQKRAYVCILEFTRVDPPPPLTSIDLIIG